MEKIQEFYSLMGSSGSNRTSQGPLNFWIPDTAIDTKTGVEPIWENESLEQSTSFSIRNLEISCSILVGIVVHKFLSSSHNFSKLMKGKKIVEMI